MPLIIKIQFPMKKCLFMFSLVIFSICLFSVKIVAQSPADPGNDPYSFSPERPATVITAPAAPAFFKTNSLETARISQDVFYISPWYFSSNLSKIYFKNIWEKSLKAYLDRSSKRALIISSKYRRLPLHQSLIAFSS